MSTFYDPAALIQNCRPGNSVVIRDSNGGVRKGKAVICSGTHVSLNMGGKYGTPGVATPDNVVSVSGKKSITKGIHNGNA